ncbi:unnamed protein product, partial [Laminaria digitata]
GAAKALSGVARWGASLAPRRRQRAKLALSATPDGATDGGGMSDANDVVSGDALGDANPGMDASNPLDSGVEAVIAAGVAAGASELKAEVEADGGAGIAVSSPPPPPPRTGDFVSKEHSRAGPFKAALLYVDYLRWLWGATDKARLDREQAGGQVSERVKVRLSFINTRTQKKKALFFLVGKWGHHATKKWKFLFCREMGTPRRRRPR